MNTTKLEKIITRCQSGFYLEVNTHKDEYLTAQDKIDYLLSIVNQDIPDDVHLRMIELDNIVEMTCYPDTPIGSYSVYHYDMDAAIDEMHTALGLD